MLLQSRMLASYCQVDGGHVIVFLAGLSKYSSQITQPKSQGASQAMLFRPQVGTTPWQYKCSEQ